MGSEKRRRPPCPRCGGDKLVPGKGIRGFSGVVHGTLVLCKACGGTGKEGSS